MATQTTTTPTDQDWDAEFARLAEPEKSRDSAAISPSTASARDSSVSFDASVVSVDVDVDVGTSRPQREGPESGSSRFAQLEKDAKNLGFRPFVMLLPDDLSTAQALLMKDYLYVSGVYETLDGRSAVLADGVPYSKRWRTEVLGLSDITVCRALKALVKLGVLEDRGETDPADGYPRGTKLYAPGSRFLVERQAPAVEVVADDEVQHEPVDFAAVGDAEVTVDGMPDTLFAPGDYTSRQGGHGPYDTTTSG